MRRDTLAVVVVVVHDLAHRFGLVGRGGRGTTTGALRRGLPARTTRARARERERLAGVRCKRACHAPRPALLLALALGGDARAALGARRVEDIHINELVVDETPQRARYGRRGGARPVAQRGRGRVRRGGRCFEVISSRRCSLSLARWMFWTSRKWAGMVRMSQQPPPPPTRVRESRAARAQSLPAAPPARAPHPSSACAAHGCSAAHMRAAPMCGTIPMTRMTWYGVL